MERGEDTTVAYWRGTMKPALAAVLASPHRGGRNLFFATVDGALQEAARAGAAGDAALAGAAGAAAWAWAAAAARPLRSHRRPAAAVGLCSG